MAYAAQSPVSMMQALVVLSRDFNNIEAFQVVVDLCKEQWLVPLACCIAYLAMIYATRVPLARHQHMLAVERGFALWNLALSLFSCWGFWHMSWGIKRAMDVGGFHFTICAPARAIFGIQLEGPLPLAMCLFAFSKILELGDTVFLILKGKKVRFLQWYHHTTVLIFCWLALATEYTPSIFCAATNYFVHSVMYLYFFLMSFPSVAWLVKPIAPLITTVQVAQMLWGLVVNAIAVGTYFSGGACDIKGVMAYCAVFAYASYFYLFGKLLFEAKGKGHAD